MTKVFKGLKGLQAPRDHKEIVGSKDQMDRQGLKETLEGVDLTDLEVSKGFRCVLSYILVSLRACLFVCFVVCFIICVIVCSYLANRGKKNSNLAFIRTA